jgi:hypothetical protein
VETAGVDEDDEAGVWFMFSMAMAVIMGHGNLRDARRPLRFNVSVDGGRAGEQGGSKHPPGAWTWEANEM